MFKYKPGDVLVLYNMPPLAANLIDWLSDGEPAHHCASVLERDGELWSYEAIPPRSRRMPLDAYLAVLGEWAANWRYKVFRRAPLSVEVWRRPGVNAEGMQIAAERLLGRRYGIVANYICQGPALHCSEYAATQLIQAREVKQSAITDKRGMPKPLSRWTPRDVKLAMFWAGWSVVHFLNPGRVVPATA